MQKYFDAELPPTQEVSDALTFHAFEIDGVENINGDDVLDVKVTPNRGHDCLSHRGIAKELSAILAIPLTSDPLKYLPDLSKKTDAVSVAIQSSLCSRYIAAYVRGVKVGPSPSWLRERLEAVGQRSINNVVDATNFVMFNIGQPLHAFDAGKLLAKDKKYRIQIRPARQGEIMTALDEKNYELAESMLVIGDENADEAIGIAGVKGGMPAAITEATNDIIIESANFDGIATRKTAAALKLRTDASIRFEQVISPELAAYGMRGVVDLLLKIAGGELIGFADEYPTPQEKKTAQVSLAQVNSILGTNLGEKEIMNALERLGLPFKRGGEMFTVSVPFERLDISIPEDLAEEVARIVGLDTVPATALSPLTTKPEINERFAAAEHARERLMRLGYSEIFTSVFADKGERTVLNKVDGVRPYLRDSLLPGLEAALAKNKPNKELLGLKEIKLFEIGSIWKDGEETILLGTISEKEKVKEIILETMTADHYAEMPLSTAQRYTPFSKYPFIVRDVAFWAPPPTDADDILSVIQDCAGGLVVKIELFDRFEKNDKVSLAYRLIFQSFDRTLTDEEANVAMEKVYVELRSKGFEIR